MRDCPSFFRLRRNGTGVRSDSLMILIAACRSSVIAGVTSAGFSSVRFGYLKVKLRNRVRRPWQCLDRRLSRPASSSSTRMGEGQEYGSGNCLQSKTADRRLYRSSWTNEVVGKVLWLDLTTFLAPEAW